MVITHYKQFHTEGILRDLEGYFKFGNYCDSVVNLIIIATTKPLNLNVSIYQKGQDGNIQALDHLI